MALVRAATPTNPTPLPQPSYEIVAPVLQAAARHEVESKLILLIQVTAFACGGFEVWFRFSHTVVDGLGAAMFMGIVGELASGAEYVSVVATWVCDSFPDLADTLVGSLPEPTGAKHLEYQVNSRLPIR